jgi:Na+-transporting NADH:ubiquinone oxidoreductase subunit B
VRDGLDLRRVMRCLVAAVLPCALVGVANVGRQAFLGARLEGLATIPGWRGELLRALGLGIAPESLIDCAAHGLTFAVPILAVSFGVGWAVERGVARLREREPSEVFPVVALLLALMLPPTLPLWQVALGIAFALVVGLEIFGGTGRNVVHPALVGLAFLYFAYPASFAGEGVWVALPGAQATRLLGAVAQDGPAALGALGIGWRDTVMGWEPGALGETSALACLLGGAFLVATGLASWRVILGGVAGLVATVALANTFGDPARPLVGLPWYWHLTTGSFAFGLVFVATDPVTSATTAAGRWAYGVLIGFLVAVVRIFNPAHPEGVLMAILLGNVLAPLLDHVVSFTHVRRRRRRLG